MVAVMSLTQNCLRQQLLPEHVVAQVEAERERIAQEELQPEAAVAGDAARQHRVDDAAPAGDEEVEVGDRSAEAHLGVRQRQDEVGVEHQLRGAGWPSRTANVRSSSGPPREVSWV